ncbi:hypothetical protein Tco_1250740 [Tanacetum coccineum]
MRSNISTVSICPKGFLPSILLLVVIVVTVVIVVVTVILVVVVVAINGVVIVVTIIGVVVVVMIIGVVGVVVFSSIIKLSFVIIVDLTGDEDPTDEDIEIGMGDSIGVSASLGGEIFSGAKKCQELNIGDSDNTRDRGKIVGGEIGACV